MKSRLIVNPVSGRDAAPDYLQNINERLRARFGEMDIVLTVAAGDATRAAAVAAREGYERLFIAGGDGTLNEVLNGVAGVEGALARLTFGLIPLGTGNDFARALGLPEDVESAVGILLEGRTVETDIGVVETGEGEGETGAGAVEVETGEGAVNADREAAGVRHFVNVSAGGFIAEVSEAVNPQLKTVAGKLAYLLGGAQVLLDYDAVGARVALTGVEGETTEREMSLEMFAVCNSRMVGGGRLIAPHALIDDGALDVCLVEAMPTLEFVALLASVSTGDHVEDERVAYLRARRLDISFSRRIKINTDGETLEVERCRYRVLPRAARFLAGDAPYARKP